MMRLAWVIYLDAIPGPHVIFSYTFPIQIKGEADVNGVLLLCFLSTDFPKTSRIKNCFHFSCNSITGTVLALHAKLAFRMVYLPLEKGFFLLLEIIDRGN